MGSGWAAAGLPHELQNLWPRRPPATALPAEAAAAAPTGHGGQRVAHVKVAEAEQAEAAQTRAMREQKLVEGQIGWPPHAGPVTVPFHIKVEAKGEKVGQKSASAAGQGRWHAYQAARKCGGPGVDAGRSAVTAAVRWQRAVGSSASQEVAKAAHGQAAVQLLQLPQQPWRQRTQQLAQMLASKAGNIVLGKEHEVEAKRAQPRQPCDKTQSACSAAAFAQSICPQLQRVDVRAASRQRSHRCVGNWPTNRQVTELERLESGGVAGQHAHNGIALIGG